LIKIRYRDPHELSPGLHAAAERAGRSTTVYLLPGLSAAQRRAALRRLRMSARRGYGPRLPAAQLALALAVDRIRTSIGRAGAVFRSHPAGSTVPVMVVSAGAIAFLALSAVSIQVVHPTRDSGQSSFSGADAAGIPLNTGSGPGGTARPAAGQGGPGQAGAGGQLPGGPASQSLPGTGSPAGNGTGGSGTGSGSGSGQGSGSGTSSGSGTTLSGGADPTPVPGATATRTAAAAPASAAPASTPASASASPTPSASKSGLCLNVGSLGLCV
jgi:hypothetical protein